MELKLQNSAQHKIADLMWAAQSMDEVNAILRVFGHDARVVFEMMTAAVYDEVEDTGRAEDLLQKFRL